MHLRPLLDRFSSKIRF
uniref:Uncharacterized protein n=1 Tax=Lepeophtheirus salmonis TaxID=72036 RepID=A0A0K2UKP1_LEPSM